MLPRLILKFYTIIYSRSSECVFPLVNIIWDSQGNCPGAISSGVMVRPVIWVPSAYRFIDSVPGSEVPVIVMPSVQSVSSPWASIAGAQDIVNVTSFDSSDSTPLFTAVAVNVCSPWSILSGTVKVTVQVPSSSGVMVRPVIWVPSAYRFIDSYPALRYQ